MSRHWLFVVRVAMVGALWVNTSAAQDATPLPFPTAPDPSECRVAPRPLDDVATVVGTATSDQTTSAVGTPAPFEPPEGSAVDEATAATVRATLRELFACTNAGDFLRVYALFTDDFLRSFFVGTPFSDEVAAFIGASPQPLPDEERRVIVRLGEPRLLDDGRVGVPIVLDEPADPRSEESDYAILESVEGRWLVDEIHEDADTGETPATPEP